MRHVWMTAAALTGSRPALLTVGIAMLLSFFSLFASELKSG